MLRRFAFPVALGLASIASVARADDKITCPVPEGGDPKLAMVDARERLDYLHRTLGDQARYARIWKWSWFGIGMTTLTASLIFTATSGNDIDRYDNLLIAGFSLATPTIALLFALRVESDAPAIDQLFEQTDNGRAGTCMVLARTEEIFKKGADEEAFNAGFFAHLAGILGNAVMFSIIAIEAATASTPADRDKHLVNAAFNTSVGVVLTEAQILTSPTGAAKGYKQYLKGIVARKSAVTVGVAPFFGGAMLRVQF
jgi:hypothetical protein